MQEQTYQVAVRQPLSNPQPWHRKFKAFELRSWIPLLAAVHIKDSRSAIYDYWNPNIVGRRADSRFYPMYESLTVVFLEDRRVRGHIFVNFGTVKTWLPQSKKFIRAAAQCVANSVIIIHKVRESKPTTSSERWAHKQAIVRAADPFDIRVLDYILVGDSDFRSVLDSDYPRPARRIEA